MLSLLPDFGLRSFSSAEHPICGTQFCKIMKRKNDDEMHAANGKAKKRAPSEDDIKYRFRTDLFDSTILEKYKSDYAVSKP